MIVLGVRDRRFQALAHVLCDALVRKLKIGERARNLFSANQLRDEVELLRGDPQHFAHSLRLVLAEVSLALALAHVVTLLSLNSPVQRPHLCAWLCGRMNGRRTSASVRTRRTCDRPFLRSPAPECASARYRRRNSAQRIVEEWSSVGSRF